MRTNRAQAATLLLLVGALLLPGLERRTVIRTQETRVLLTAREMAHDGNWLVPHYMGQVRLEKPPFMYWLVGTIFRLTNSATTPAYARLLSALFAAALALLIGFGGRALVGQRAAFLAGTVAPTSLLFVRYGGLAETDMPLTLFTTAAVLAGLHALRNAQRAAPWVACGLCMGVGFMFKGPAALFIPLLTIFGWRVTRMDQRVALNGKGLALGLLLFLLVAAPWYIAVSAQPLPETLPGKIFTGELGKIVEGYGHVRPFYYYLLRLPLYLLPWGLALPFACVWTVQAARRREGARLLLVWWLVALLLLSVVRKKQEHYALLMLPPSALMLGVFFECALEPARGWAARVGRVCIAMIVAVMGLAGLGAAGWSLFRTGDVGGVVFGGLAALIAGYAFRRRAGTYARPWVMVHVLMIVCATAYTVVFHDRHRPASVIPEFARAGRRYVDAHPGAGFFATPGHVDSLTFYFGRVPTPVPDPATFQRRAQPGAFLVAVGDEDRPLDFAAIPGVPLVDMQRGPLRCALYRKAEQPATGPPLEREQSSSQGRVLFPSSHRTGLVDHTSGSSECHLLGEQQ